MADKLMYIPNDKTQNYPFCRLKLVVETFGNLTSSYQISLKVPLVFKPTNKKTLLKTFRDENNKQPIVPFLPDIPLLHTP